MVRAIKESVIIKPGGMVELRHPDLREGATVEVIVLLDQPAAEPPPLTSLIGKGKGCFGSAEEVDAFLRAERDAWDR